MTDLAEPLPGVTPARVRHPARGYLLYLVAALLFAVNGTVSKTLLLGGIDATVLSQVRATAAFLILLAFVALTRPAALRLRRSELPLLLVYGVLGIALTQVLYFAVDRAAADRDHAAHRVHGAARDRGLVPRRAGTTRRSRSCGWRWSRRWSASRSSRRSGRG